MNVNAQMLPDYQKQVYKIYYDGKTPKDEKTSKLIVNLKDKEKYVVHNQDFTVFSKNEFENDQSP